MPMAKGTLTHGGDKTPRLAGPGLGAGGRTGAGACTKVEPPRSAALSIWNNACLKLAKLDKFSWFSCAFDSRAGLSLSRRLRLPAPPIRVDARSHGACQVLHGAPVNQTALASVMGSAGVPNARGSIL